MTHLVKNGPVVPQAFLDARGCRCSHIPSKIRSPTITVYSILTMAQWPAAGARSLTNR
jgi:hypothetical protein